MPYQLQWWSTSLPAPVVSYAAPAKTVSAAPAEMVDYISPAPAMSAAGLPGRYAVPVQHAVPTLPVAGINLNRDDIPDVLQQPQVGFAAPTQNGASVPFRAQVNHATQAHADREAFQLSCNSYRLATELLRADRLVNIQFSPAFTEGRSVAQV